MQVLCRCRLLYVVCKPCVIVYLFLLKNTMSSSPITKFNHFSRLFSSKSSISPRSALLSSTPHLDSCTPGLLLLPDELVRKVETPFSHRSPSHCSTPALFLKARSNYRACSRKSARSVDSKCNAKFHTHLQKKILPKASRNRRFGISDNFESEREVSLKCDFNTSGGEANEKFWQGRGTFCLAQTYI